MDPEARRQFVRDHRTCIFGYGRQEHGPAMTVVYYVMDGDDILVSTMAERQAAARRAVQVRWVRVRQAKRARANPAT